MRNAYWDDGRKLLVFWTPKSACTAVSNWFARGLLGLQIPKGSGGARAWLIDNGYRHRPESAVKLAKTQASHSIAFTRHPFDRLISAYVNKFVVFKDARLVRFDQLEEFAKQLYCRIRSVTPAAARRSYDGITFEEMLVAIDEACRTAGKREPDLNGHVNRQYPVIFADHGVVPAEIVDIASMNDELDRINARYGVDYLPAKTNSTTYRGDGSSPLWNVKSADLAASGVPLSKQGFVTSDTIALARRSHAVDYEVFGYADAPAWASMLVLKGAA